MDSERRRRFGMRVRALREARDLSMQELANLACISYEYVRAIETGNKQVDKLTLIEALAGALGVTREDLLDPERPLVMTPEEQVLQMLKRGVAALSGVPTPYMGRVPADMPRPVDELSEERTVPVPREWIGSRSPDDLFVVRASGDCMVQRGIRDGSYVLCEWARGREPRNGDLVVVWVSGERSLKLWHRNGSRIELHDGDGNCVAKLTVDDDIMVVGFWVADWRTRDDIEPIG